MQETDPGCGPPHVWSTSIGEEEECRSDNVKRRAGIVMYQRNEPRSLRTPPNSTSSSSHSNGEEEDAMLMLCI